MYVYYETQERTADGRQGTPESQHPNAGRSKPTQPTEAPGPRLTPRRDSRPTAESAMAGVRQLVEDALHAVHNDRARDLLRVEGHEGARRRARTVIGRIATVQRRVAGEAAQAARGVRAHAAQRLVHEEVTWPEASASAVASRAASAATHASKSAHQAS